MHLERDIGAPKLKIPKALAWHTTLSWRLAEPWHVQVGFVFVYSIVMNAVSSVPPGE